MLIHWTIIFKLFNGNLKLCERMCRKTVINGITLKFNFPCLDTYSLFSPCSSGC